MSVTLHYAIIYFDDDWERKYLDILLHFDRKLFYLSQYWQAQDLILSPNPSPKSQKEVKKWGFWLKLYTFLTLSVMLNQLAKLYLNSDFRLSLLEQPCCGCSFKISCVAPSLVHNSTTVNYLERYRINLDPEALLGVQLRCHFFVSWNETLSCFSFHS